MIDLEKNLEIDTKADNFDVITTSLKTFSVTLLREKGASSPKQSKTVSKQLSTDSVKLC